MLKVRLVFRKRLPTAYSIEYLFHSIFDVLQNKLSIEEYELPCLSTGLINRLRNLLSLLRFRNKIIHITGDCYYAILGALFCKRIITVHDLSFLERTSGIQRRILKLFWVTLPVKASHIITVVSQTTKQQLLHHTNTNPAKIKVIYNFIDPLYQPIKRTFNTANPKILQVGTDFNKNIVRIAKALEGIDCTLMVIGRLSDSQVAALNASNIHFLNRFALPIEELHKEYLAADMLLFASTVEGFGLPILEAQATGLPVITSNCSSMPEVGGKGAVFVDPFDTNSIRNGILTIIKDEPHRELLVEEGYKNVTRFSKEKIAADYAALYQSFSDPVPA